MSKFCHSKSFRHSGESRNPVERESQYLCHKIPSFAGMTVLLAGGLQ